MKTPASNLHLAWARLFVHGLVSAGVRDVVISPGSRSTPLVLATAQERGLTCHTIIDERSAAFFALGQVRATGRPTALLCTSGTAGAHYLPAIIEASETFLPLVVVTADRPWEACGVASPQTIDQLKLFGDHVRRFFDIGAPEATSSALRGVVRAASQAVHRSLGPEPGPVHLNLRFRKPLEPVEVDGPEAWQTEVNLLLARGAPSFRPAPRLVDQQAVHDLAKACTQARRGVIACGPAAYPLDDGLRLAIGSLSIATGFPIFAEATSQVRFGPTAQGVTLCGAFDALLRAPGWAEAPELIVEVGSTPVSGAYASWLEKHWEVPRWVIAPHGWHDPFNSATVVVQASPASFVSEVAAWVAAIDDDRPRNWAKRWLAGEATAWSRVEQEWTRSELTEATIPRLLSCALPEGAFLIVGNSNPVRDLDTFAPPQERALRVVHQRGASGIDGLVSGAAGLRSVVEAPVALYLGDVSALHDVGALASSRGAQKPLVIVVVQNDGGRIFEQLPLGRRAELSEPLARCFVTSHGTSFEHAAAMFGIKYRSVVSGTEFSEALRTALGYGGCTLIEAVVPPTDGVQRRSQLWRDVAGLLKEARP